MSKSREIKSITICVNGFEILGIVLATLKLFGVLENYSWLLVTAPIWTGFIIRLIVFLFRLTLCLIAIINNARQRRN